jgi:predicted metal-dependent phosphoesterase TrpH
MSAARGLIHVHSSYSYDCEIPLMRIRELAQQRQYRFVLQTEHSNELTREEFLAYRDEARALSDSEFLLVPGIEYSSEDNRIHILTFGPEEFWEELRLFPLERGVELLDRVHEAGGVAILAHPERASALERLPQELLARLDGIEVWNYKTDRTGPSPAALELLQRWREAGREGFGTAGLDLHREKDLLPVGLELAEMPAGEAALLDSLRNGAFRVFAGPLRWDPASAGAFSRGAARASRSFVRTGRRWKARLLARLRRRRGGGA